MTVPSATPARVVAIALLALLAVTGCRPSSPPTEALEESGVVTGAAAPRPGTLPARRALEVVRDWHAARTEAWRDGSVDALRRLYLDRSLGDRDTVVLRSYLRRGVAVAGLEHRVGGLRLHRVARRLVDVTVLGSVVRTTVVVDGRARSLPVAAPRSLRLVLVRPAGRWLLSSARVA